MNTPKIKKEKRTKFPQKRSYRQLGKRKIRTNRQTNKYTEIRTVGKLEKDCYITLILLKGYEIGDIKFISKLCTKISSYRPTKWLHPRVTTLVSEKGQISS